MKSWHSLSFTVRLCRDVLEKDYGKISNVHRSGKLLCVKIQISNDKGKFLVDTDEYQ